MDAKRLYEFIEAEAGRAVDERSLDLKIEGDLGIYGDEAVDFIERFAREFEVDVSTFKIHRYFSPESDRFSLFLFRIFSRTRRLDMTIGDLKEAILRGRLE
jgi:hypothetical protein